MLGTLQHIDECRADELIPCGFSRRRAAMRDGWVESMACCLSIIIASIADAVAHEETVEERL